jgi:hypothetical protein
LPLGPRVDGIPALTWVRVVLEEDADPLHRPPGGAADRAGGGGGIRRGRAERISWTPPSFSGRNFIPSNIVRLPKRGQEPKGGPTNRAWTAGSPTKLHPFPHHTHNP